MKWIISNYKDKIVQATYKNKVKELESSHVKIVVCPNDKQLLSYKDEKCLLGSQDVNYMFNAKELKDMSVQYTIVGHSDKRKKYLETNQEIQEKIKELLSYDICPILCVGEEQEEEECTTEILKQQLEESLEGIKTNIIMIAYEPVWAIGTNEIPSNRDIEETIKFIKHIVKSKLSFSDIPVLYGGSINSKNIKTLNKIENCSGFLVGGSSLKVKELCKIIEVAVKE